MGYDNEASSSSNPLPPFPNEETPLLPTTSSNPSQQQLSSSQFKTFANIFIAMVGAGVLGLPYTFKKTGWVMGSLMLLTVAIITYNGMMLLVHTRRWIESRHGYSKIASYGDLGFAVCGPVGRLAVDLMLVLAQAGFCVSYLIFIANTLANMFNKNSSSSWFLGLSPKIVYLWSCFPFQLGLNSIPSLTHLASLSIFADIVDLGAIGVIMVEDVLKFAKRIPELKVFGGFSVFFYGVGVAVYAFEGIGMILPFESEIRKKEKFGKVLSWSMAFITLIYGAFGALGYFAFGEGTKDIITHNFGNGILNILVQLGLCINLFFTFPIMMNPVYEIVERRLCRARYCLWIRWLVVLFVTLVALFVPNFTDFLALVGSSVCIGLAFVLPALFHMMVFKQELRKTALVLDGLLLAFGLIFGVSGTTISLQEIFSATA